MHSELAQYFQIIIIFYYIPSPSASFTVNFFAGRETLRDERIVRYNVIRDGRMNPPSSTTCADRRKRCRMMGEKKNRESRGWSKYYVMDRWSSGLMIAKGTVIESWKALPVTRHCISQSGAYMLSPANNNTATCRSWLEGGGEWIVARGRGELRPTKRVTRTESSISDRSAVAVA